MKRSDSKKVAKQLAAQLRDGVKRGGIWLHWNCLLVWKASLGTLPGAIVSNDEEEKELAEQQSFRTIKSCWPILSSRRNVLRLFCEQRQRDVRNRHLDPPPTASVFSRRRLPI